MNADSVVLTTLTSVMGFMVVSSYPRNDGRMNVEKNYSTVNTRPSESPIGMENET
jgi:hypothetical protein